MQHIKYVHMRAGAILLFMGMVTGIFVSAAMTGKLPADGKMMLAAHLNAILGAFMLFGYALSVAYLKYEEKKIALIGKLLLVANYANWLITTVKGFVKVHGIDLTGNIANDMVFGALTLFVVLPALVATLLWCLGFQRHGVPRLADHVSKSR